MDRRRRPVIGRPALMLNPRAPAPNTPRRQTAQITATLPMGILRQGERAVKGRAGCAPVARHSLAQAGTSAMGWRAAMGGGPEPLRNGPGGGAGSRPRAPDSERSQHERCHAAARHALHHGTPGGAERFYGLPMAPVMRLGMEAHPRSRLAHRPRPARRSVDRIRTSRALREHDVRASGRWLSRPV